MALGGTNCVHLPCQGQGPISPSASNQPGTGQNGAIPVAGITSGGWGTTLLVRIGMMDGVGTIEVIK